MIDHLRLRNFILCFVGADSYAFVHRTFLEYFCAAEFVHQFNVAKSLDLDGLIALFDEHCRQDEWREVLRLMCGQIDEVFVGQIVERLATRTDLETWDGCTPLPELPLAIGCLSEVRTIQTWTRTLLGKVDQTYFRRAAARIEPADLRLHMNWICQNLPRVGWAPRWPGTATGIHQVLAIRAVVEPTLHGRHSFAGLSGLRCAP